MPNYCPHDIMELANLAVDKTDTVEEATELLYDALHVLYYVQEEFPDHEDAPESDSDFDEPDLDEESDFDDSDDSDNTDGSEFVFHV